MPFPLAGLGPLSPLSPLPKVSLDASSGKADAFGSVLQDAIQKVEGLGSEASKSVESFLSGEDDDLHKTIMATQRADLAGELFLQVRNKVVSAYQEVMRMQV
jgi:flagellar hook-basal body complex protein FliE